MWKNCSGLELLCRNDLKPLDVLAGVGVMVLFSWFFYRSLWVLPLMTVPGAGYVYLAMVARRRRRLRLEREQFKECILSVGASLRAGYAVANAFVESGQDMRMLYGDGSYVVKELRLLEQGLKNREPLETLLEEWGARSEIGEIGEFADVLAIGKRNGGSIPEIIGATSEMISRKVLLEEELETLLANKRLEQQVMNIMPFAMVFYLEWSNPGYFNMLYEGYVGRLLMTGCLVGYVFAYWLSQRILQKIYD
ncbi:MAG: hypothetical protein IJZ82_11045 [Lachnospiraceae bacterium]|nr:hypothetical protein [Lachnospiraceae bacterium]